MSTIWIGAGIESVVFSSTTGAGRNIVVYLPNAGPYSVAVRNRDEILAALRRTRAVKPGRKIPFF